MLRYMKLVGRGLEHFIRPFCTGASLNNYQSAKIKSTKNIPPKGKIPETTAQLGRFGTSLKVGIVGIPNVGKSTFFNVLTSSQVAAENFPFCTIDPSESRVLVPDMRFDFLCEYFKPANKVPAFLNIVDIAGLIEGSSEGAGLGNSFLSHISACDAIFQMLRAFDDEDIIHIDGSIDPIKDLRTVLNELRMKDIEYFEGRFNDLKKKCLRTSDEKIIEEFKIVTKVLKLMKEDKKHLRFIKDWNKTEMEVLNRHLPLTGKPMVYLVNLSEKDFTRKKNDWLPKIQQWINKNDTGAQLIPFSGAFEMKALTMEPEEFQKYCEKVKVQSVLPKIIKSGFNLLQLEYFFTVGKNEVKAWTIQNGTKAPEAAGKIHTDFKKGFNIAEVMKFDDFKEHGSKGGVKAAGKYYKKGKQYTVCDGDIIFFRFNCAKRGKK